MLAHYVHATGLLCLSFAVLPACLPQAKSGPADSDSVTDTSVEDAVPDTPTGPEQTWRMMRLMPDQSDQMDADAEDPGVDLDAIVVFEPDGTFAFAGCQSMALWDTSEPPQLSLEQDPATATLTAKDGVSGEAGYLSLGARIFECSFPRGVVTGSAIEIWTLESPAPSVWTVMLSTDVSEDYLDTGITGLGSERFIAP